MQRTWVVFAVGLALLGSAGCGDPEPAINRVGVNVVDKAVFQDAWYMSRTVIDVDYEAAGLGTFPGDAASDAAQDFTAMPRIRWAIDEDYLFAYRNYELTEGGDGKAKSVAGTQDPANEFKGQPVAVYAIEKHFDIRREYNPSTGEQSNVIVENDTDRRWFERQYMRVDWSKNLLPGYYGQTYNLYELLGNWKREPADLFVQDASRFPDSWQPRFDRMVCDGLDDTAAGCTEAERDLAGDYARDELYHMSFVSQEVMSPGMVPDPQTGAPVNWCTAKLYSDAPACSSVVSYVRTSFLKVSESRQYEPVDWVDSRFDRFGYFRLSQSTYDRNTGSASDPAFFATDFLNYNVNRHNIWQSWRDSEGKPVPFGERRVRPVVWYSTPELPAHLVQPSFDVVGQWNEVFMETVRKLRGEALPRYPDVQCQSADPDGYCYCQKDPQSGDVIRPSCPGRYDPFHAPEDYGEGTEDAYDCWVQVPEGTEPDLDDGALTDADFNGWFDARFVGDECVSVLRLNSCNRATRDAQGGFGETECQERGDLRYKFLSYVDQPGTGFLGIATLRGDPVTGEILAGDANIGGPALDAFRTTALQAYDLIHGTLDERDLVTGEDVRAYFESINHVDLPAQPRTDFTVASKGAATVPSATSARTMTEIDGRMDGALSRLQRLQGAEGRNNVYSDRKQALVGSALEQRLTQGLESWVMAGYESLPEGAGEDGKLSEEMLDRVSPLRNDAHAQLASVRDAEDRLARANVMMPNEYADDSVLWFVDKHRDWSRARLEFGLNRLLYRQTQLHELGHCLGLRHDFGSSADSGNYQDAYYEIAERYPLPEAADYDLDGTPGLSGQEQGEFEGDYAAVRSLREQVGIDGAANSSVMEYTANWYQRLQPIGKYDRAAVLYGYGELSEVVPTGAGPTAARRLLKDYLGGERCEQDADCPFAVGGKAEAQLLGENRDRGLTQRCVPSTRTPGQTLCSSLADDLAAAAADGADLEAVKYRFCSDERAAGNLAWCSRFDEGADYRDIVRNIAESYDRMYLFSAFRRYKKRFSFGEYRAGLIDRRLGVLQTIYQNLIFEYVNNPEFRAQQGAFGFYDQFLATTDILNFYAKIMTLPNVGGYDYDESRGTYRLASLDPYDEDTELSVPLGLGRYFNSDYQAGLSGIERLERIGSFADKLWVIQLLTTRGWQQDLTRDLAFYTNFYDLFPNEVQQIFNGLIRQYPAAYMPRIVCPDAATSCEEPRLVYMDFYRGDCSRPETCRPNPAEVTYAGLPVLDGGGSLSLQIYAAVYGLSDFPVYFDSSFQNQLFICVEGQGDCFQPDPSAVEGTDYVRYTSARYRKSFVAFQVEPAVGVGEQTSIGFAMVKEARDLATSLGVLRELQGTVPPYDPAGLSPESLAAVAAIGYELPDRPGVVLTEILRMGNRIQDLESFFNQMIEIQRDYGIQGAVVWR
jgi:hypothetical protein